ncbi:MAG: DUF3307 domain-containing protein [Anaerolineaceae bacterium]|nr:DUF3307 domain-containing protein [Anaerolineaceae bacterium]
MNTPFFQLTLSLILAHLVGDFLLQTSSLAKMKKKSLWMMVLHSLINGAAAYLILASWRAWLVPLIISVSHFLIDFAKSRFKKDSLWLFLADQALHVSIMLLFVVFYLLPNNFLSYWFEKLPEVALPVMVILSSLILLTFAGGLFIGYCVRPFQERIKDYFAKLKKEPVEGLKEGGKMIGWLERLLIFVFVLTGQYAGVGFLIAAKSVFRFGELKESENRKEAEYIIIGTFISFLFGLAVSILARLALGIK